MGTADAVSSVGVLDSGVTVLIIRAVDLLAIDRSVNEDEERIRNVLWRSCGVLVAKPHRVFFTQHHYSDAVTHSN